MSFQPNLKSRSTHLFIKGQELRAHYRNASKAYLKQVVLHWRSMFEGSKIIILISQIFKKIFLYFFFKEIMTRNTLWEEEKSFPLN